MTSSQSSSEPRTIHLTAATSLRPADDAAGDLPPRVNDLPAFYYWKEAIRVGSYVHPTDTYSLKITRDRLDSFAANFAKMKRNGVGVPILMDHANTAAATLGWIVDVKRDGDQLLELHQFLGEKARDTGLRNKVSLGICPDFVDGTGVRYGEAIVHSAVTPTPVVNPQEDYQPVETDVLTLTLATPAPAIVVTECNAPVVTENGTARRLASTLRDQAIARGGLSPAVASELFSLLVDRPDMMLLSTTEPTGLPIAAAVFELLSKNQSVPTGELTGIQMLHRQTPGDETGPLQSRMIAMASGK